MTQDEVDKMVRDPRQKHIAEQRKALYDDTRRELHTQRRRNVQTLTRKQIATDLGTLRALYSIINLGLNRRELVRRRALHLARLRGLVLFLRPAKDWGSVNFIVEVLKSAGHAPPDKTSDVPDEIEAAFDTLREVRRHPRLTESQSATSSRTPATLPLPCSSHPPPPDLARARTPT